jgi:hypothetical protein
LVQLSSALIEPVSRARKNPPPSDKQAIAGFGFALGAVGALFMGAAPDGCSFAGRSAANEALLNTATVLHHKTAQILLHQVR